MKQSLAMIAFSVLAASIVFAQPRSKVAGTWLLSVDVGDTHGTPTVVLRQQGGTLTGTVESKKKMSGTVEFTGGVTGSGTWVATKK